MPDEFPTLEAVAALATLAALVRVMQVSAALGELRRLSGEIARALRSGDRMTARRIATESEGAAFSGVVNSLLDALGSAPVDHDALVRTVEHASARVAKRSRRASTSGGLIGLLLVGLLFYAVVSRVNPGAGVAPSTLFDLLVVLGVVVLAIGATEMRRAALSMLEAATNEPKEPT
jgi:membrane protein required for beta-lactamase induction